MTWITRRIGIEIEAETVNTSYMAVFSHLRGLNQEGEEVAWEVLEDGSLRGGSNSWEIRTVNKESMTATVVLNALTQLLPVMGDSTGTWRAAVHTHVDVRDFNARTLAKLLAVLYCADQHIFETHAPHRVESNFCVPLYNITPTCTQYITDLTNGIPPVGFEDWNKYTSCNLKSIDRFGTVEFRHMETPRSASREDAQDAIKKINDFASLCVRLVDYVFRRRSHTLPDILTGLPDALEITPCPERMFEVLSAFSVTTERAATGEDAVLVADALGYREVEPELPPPPPAPPLQPDRDDYRGTSDILVTPTYWDDVLSTAQGERIDAIVQQTDITNWSTDVLLDNEEVA